MSARVLRPGAIVAIAGVAVAIVCVAVFPQAAIDPIRPLETASAVVLSIWGAIGIRALIQGQRLARALDRRSTPGTAEGVSYQMVRGGGRHAFVIGTVKPRIYVGDELIHGLDASELRAVLLHEDHHRQTRAPLRAAALEAWLALLGRSRRVREVLRNRLTDLEEEADAAALARGAEVFALASALLKADSSLAVGVSFADASARRVRTLVARAEGVDRVGEAHLPYEWLPAAIGGVVALACQMTGMSPFR